MDKNKNKDPETASKNRVHSAQASAAVKFSRLFSGVLFPVFAILILSGGVFCLLRVRKVLYENAGGLRVSMSTPGGPEEIVHPTPDLDETTIPPSTQKVIYKGWLWVHRTGKFVFATHMRGQVDFSINGRSVIRDKTRPRRIEGHRNPIAHPRNLKKAQTPINRGWQKIEIIYTPPDDTPGGLRLLWQPPGRRGDPEYIDPVFLSPSMEKPKTPGPSTPRLRDGVIATAILILLLLFAAALFRSPLRSFIGRCKKDPSFRLQLYAALALFILAAGVRVVNIGAAGQTWDEDVYFGAGRNYLQNLLALDFRPESWVWNLEHPPVGKYIIGWASLWSESMNPARAVQALLGALTISASFLAGKRLLGWFPALTGSLLLLFSPHLIGHSKIAGLETPSVAFITLCVLTYLATIPSGDSTSQAASKTTSHPNALLIATGLFCGLALSTRWLNGAVLFLIASLFLVDIAPQLKKRTEKVHVHPAIFLVPVIMFATTFVIWPRLWSHPFSRIAETFGHYPEALTVKEYFLGKHVSPPPHYFLTYFSAVVPAVFLVAWFAFFASWCDNSRKRSSKTSVTVSGRSHLILFLWWLIPMAAGLAGPMKQDGIRYVLPSLVPAALMAAQGFSWLASLVTKLATSRLATGDQTDRRSRWIIGILAFAFVLESMVASVRIHPYYINYYNFFWGGPKNVAQKRLLEFSWWGEGLEPATHWINKNAPENARVALQVHARHVMVFRPDIRVSDNPANADFIVRAGDALQAPPPQGFKPAHSETARGTNIVEVFSR